MVFQFCYDKQSDLMQIDLFAITARAKMLQSSIYINNTYFLLIDVKHPRQGFNISGQNLFAVETVNTMMFILHLISIGLFKLMKL